jgi:hypothetical protein
MEGKVTPAQQPSSHPPGSLQPEGVGDVSTREGFPRAEGLRSAGCVPAGPRLYDDGVTAVARTQPILVRLASRPRPRSENQGGGWQGARGGSSGLSRIEHARVAAHRGTPSPGGGPC